MVKDVLEEAKKGMDKSVEALQVDLAALRTGRASTGLVNKLLVEYYGTQTTLQELAMVSIPEPQLIAIRPYDSTALKAIERAIMQSDLGMTPNNDGKIIRLQVPALTEERRRNLVKTASRRTEEARVSVRNIRRDHLEDLRAFEKEKLISEDEFHGGQDDLQKLTDTYIKKVSDIGAAKEKEILEV
jgi:ribosome recycling factor